MYGWTLWRPCERTPVLEQIVGVGRGRLPCRGGGRGGSVRGRMLRMTCRCGGKAGGEAPGCGSATAAPHTGVGATLPCPGSAFGVGALAGRRGPGWQQVPSRQLESASACAAICPLRLSPSHLLLTTEGPGAVPQHKGEAPGWGGGRQLSILPLFGAVFLVLWCCQVCGKFAGCCQPAFRWPRW